MENFQSSYFTGKVVKSLEGSKTRNYDQPIQAAGKDTEHRRTTVACCKCEDQYFPGHCYANKTIMTMEKIVTEGTLREKIQ